MRGLTPKQKKRKVRQDANSYARSPHFSTICRVCSEVFPIGFSNLKSATMGERGVTEGEILYKKICPQCGTDQDIIIHGSALK